MPRKRKAEDAKEAASSRGGRPKTLDEVFDRFQAYVGELYNPVDMDGELAPAETHMGAARSKPFDVSVETTQDNQVVVAKMYPRLQDTLVMSVGGTTPAPATTNAVFIEFEDTVAANTTVGGAHRPEKVSGGTTNPDFELPTVLDTVSGETVNAVEAAVGAGAAVPYVLFNRSVDGCQARLYFRDAVTGVWAPAGQQATIPGGASVFAQTGALANGADRFAVVYRNGSTSVRALNVLTVINAPSFNTVATTLTYPTTSSVSYSAMDNPQAVDEVRIRSFDILLTFMGDLTTMGGRWASALVPREWIPDPEDIVGSIAALPTGAQDGKLVDGCHQPWQPRTPSDRQYHPPEVDHGSYYIIVAALVAKQSTVLRVKARFNYDIYSLDPSLGAMAWCPSDFGLSEVLLQVFRAVPSGSTNDAHEKKAKKATALATLRRLAMKPLDWVMKNPEEAAKWVAKGISTVALAL